MVNLKIITVIVGPLRTNCFLIIDQKTNQSLVLDPGDEPEKILQIIDNQRLIVNTIVVTHCHFDHVGGVALIQKRLQVPFLIPQGEKEILADSPKTAQIWTGQTIETPPQPEKLLEENDDLAIGKTKLKIMATPGHSQGGISLYHPIEKVLFSGDTLFAGTIGRTDLPTSSEKKMKQSLKKLLSLPDETLVFPGHGKTTTIQQEKMHHLSL